MNNSNSNTFSDVLQQKFNSHKFQIITALCLFIWTPLLITKTLYIQHSCHPMVDIYHLLPKECNQSPISHNFSSKKSKLNKSTDETSNFQNYKNSSKSSSPHIDTEIASKNNSPQLNHPNDDIEIASTDNLDNSVISNVKAGTAGVAAGVTAALVGAPIAVAAGVAILTWFAVKRFL
jgi:hypothetical protein